MNLSNLKKIFTPKLILIIAIGIIEFALSAILLIPSGWSFGSVVIRLIVIAAMGTCYWLFYEICFYQGATAAHILPWLISKMSTNKGSNSHYIEGKLDAFREVAGRLRESEIVERIRKIVTSKIK